MSDAEQRLKAAMNKLITKVNKQNGQLIVTQGNKTLKVRVGNIPDSLGTTTLN